MSAEDEGLDLAARLMLEKDELRRELAHTRLLVGQYVFARQRQLNSHHKHTDPPCEGCVEADSEAALAVAAFNDLVMLLLLPPPPKRGGAAE